MTESFSLVALSEAYSHVCAALHSTAFSGSEQWSVGAFAELLAMPGTTGWIITEHDEPAGLLLVRHCLDEAEILTLAVHPAYRRKGIAASLIETALSFLREQGTHTVFLEVSVQNQPATRLYSGQGFLSCGIRRAYYADGSDALVLRYDLRNEIR